MNFIALLQALVLTCATPPADPPPHLLELVQFEGTGGDLATRDPHEVVALTKYKRTAHYYRWTFHFAY